MSENHDNLEHDPAEDARIEQELKDKAGKPRDEYMYTLKPGETIWSVATKLGVDAMELLEHNDLSADQAYAGVTIHLINPKPAKLSEGQIRYEVYNEPEIMHVIKEGGARKYVFGNIKHLADLIHSGPMYRESANIEIVAAAHVPVDDTTMVFYMDIVALGAYVHTGRVSYTVGFDSNEVSPGKYIPPTVEESIKKDIAHEPAQKPPKPKEPEPPTLEPEVLPPEHIEKLIEEDIAHAQNPIGVPSYKTSYQKFEEPVTYRVKETIKVYELDGKRPERQLSQGKFVSIAGTFVRGGIEYGRPFSAANITQEGGGLWWGIPMYAMEPEDDLYSYEPTVKVGNRGVLNTQEELVVIGSKIIAKVTRVQIWIDKKRKK